MYKKLAKIGLVLAAVMTILISLAPSRDESLARLVKRVNAKNMQQAPFDVIIVPGYPYKAATYPELFTSRLFFAKELYDSGIARHIIFSGAAVHTEYEEGKIMREFAVALGIPEEKTFIEPNALHSWQNVKYGKRLAKELGFKKIAVATDPFQFSYIRLLAPGMSILSFLPDTSSMKKYILPLPQIDVSKVRVKDFTPLREH